MTEPATTSAGADARRLAIEAVTRVNQGGAYANLVLSPMLGRSNLDRRDRGLVTELVYGTVRRRRSCDWLVDRFLHDPDVDPPVRAALQVGAYQLAFLGSPPHAAVSATVGAMPRRVRGLVNAVLRRVADDVADGVSWPDLATELSYPDWIVDTLVADLGADDAHSMLDTMNAAAEVTERADGYVQDLGSQYVVEALGATGGDLVLDLCAAPGGKATAAAGAGATVVAADRRASRARLVGDNAARLGVTVPVVVADAVAPPFVDGCADRVLVDAPCSGLGTLRRRADARWRIDSEAPERLGRLQRAMVDAAAALVAPGGSLVYSVCTVTRAETVDVAAAVTAAHPDLVPVRPAGPWRQWGTGGLLLPHDLGTDAMAVFVWRRN